YSKIRPNLAKAIVAGFDGVCSADMYPLSFGGNPRYLLWVLLSDYFTVAATKDQNRVVLPKINQAALSRIPIPHCSLPEQHEVVRRVDELFARADALEARVADARKLAARLEPAILAKAFRGELSEQVPEEAVEWERKLAEIEEAAKVLGEGTGTRTRGRKPKAGAAVEVPAKVGRPRGRPRRA
ncbi:MAG: hypothetical protein WCL50_12710, partial [Spirochaetota bacterium]